ncbi:hypothetical protein [Roseiconus lacunae]|uniref:Uncharacterized protein n=1 Tax=Roseiconus lacunae TaxID=2605694 RepID=A0ABT7PH39_9BACT|nr:hypothetical protein [Roseiconus lacunae]MDM4015819.1 hypothetical protein [Roseiconus lacunae]
MSSAYQNERFKLPDGSIVGTGNNFDASAEKLVTSKPFPDELMLDNADIQRLMKRRSLAKERDHRRKRMQNQGRVGSCNAEMVVAGAHQLQESTGRPHVPLASNHLYARINGGRDNGSALAKGMRAMVDIGCGRRDLVPVQTYNRRQQGNRLNEADADGMHRRIHEPYVLPDDFRTFVRALASAIARGMPVGLAWHVGGGSMRLRNGYIVHGRGAGNHATLGHSGKWVGGSDIIHPDIQNSWGPCIDPAYGVVSRGGWGDGGFGLTTPEALFACRRYHTFYVFTSIIDDSRDTQNNPL